VGSLGFRRQFVWMMLNELSPPWLGLSPHEWWKNAGHKSQLHAFSWQFGQVLYFVIFLLFSVLLRFSSDSLNFYSCFFPLIFPL